MTTLIHGNFAGEKKEKIPFPAERLIPLRQFCRNRAWPRLPQFQNWINRRHRIAVACIKKIGKRYLIDVEAFENYIREASIDE